MPIRLFQVVFLLTIASLFNMRVTIAEEDISAKLGDFLKAGEVADAEKFLKQQLATSPEHGQARFGLGVVQVLSAIEELGQTQYQYGAMNNLVVNFPILRLPVPSNPNPEEVTFTQVRQIFLHFQTRLIAAEAEMAKIDLTKPVKLPLDLMAIRLDFNGDGARDKNETFYAFANVAIRQRPGVLESIKSISFDNGDVPWLRGYCHFLCAVCDIVLAYDEQRMFDVSGHLLYPKYVPSQNSSAPLNAVGPSRDFSDQIVDAIAAIHLSDFPLKEPKRMASARQHLLAMIRTSRESWALITKETDDDNEWLPNPSQKGVLQVPLTRELIDGWHGVLNEMEDLLEGRKLIPFWRDYYRGFIAGGQSVIPSKGRGINLKRFFDEPSRFDLILAIQGSGMLPYLEEGELSRPETWDDLTRVFRGQFFGFSAWFN
jgi:hypothetical protein